MGSSESSKDTKDTKTEVVEALTGKRGRLPDRSCLASERAFFAERDTACSRQPLISALPRLAAPGSRRSHHFSPLRLQPAIWAQGPWQDGVTVSRVQQWVMPAAQSEGLKCPKSAQRSKSVVVAAA